MWVLAQSTAPPETEVVDWWLKHASMQGLAFVFVACVLLILLWVAVMVIRLLQKWIPEWFQSSIKTHDAVRHGVREIAAIAKMIRRDTFSTRVGLGNLLAGLEALAKKPESRMRLGISSDVLLWIKNAKKEIERDDRPDDTSELDDWRGVTEQDVASAAGDGAAMPGGDGDSL